MRMRWHGQSCFLLTSASGTRVLMDPFGPGLGYQVPRLEAELVTTSHHHFDHDYLGGVRGNFFRIDRPGRYSIQGVEIEGIATFHDDRGGAKRGPNIVYRLAVDGIKVCHCGDLGHLLSPEQVEALGEIDVLLLPVGGRFAITLAEALATRAALGPAVTIPMHYRTGAMGPAGLLFAPLRRFLALAAEEPGGAPRVATMDRPDLEIDRSALEALRGIVVMKLAGDDP